MPAAQHGRLWTLAGCRVVHDTGLCADRELTLSLQLRAGGGLVVIPYGSAPGREAPFVLRTFSSVAIEMTQVRRAAPSCLARSSARSASLTD